MTKKLWQDTPNINKLVELYTSGEDVLWDQDLVRFDIYGSLAHANMLARQKLIGKKDFENIRKGLLEILDHYQKDKYLLKPGDEDVHTRIENDLTQKFPESGAKLHTGRSRNDQILVDTRLYTKVQLINVALNVLELAEIFLKQAKKLSDIPLPGMTHMQPAMLSSFGLWLGAFTESLLDDLLILEFAYSLNDQSPLGSGAAYGVTLPIDRKYTAKLLGFARVQNNALYCQNSRGKIEVTVIHALSQVMATLNKFASDSLLFTTEPFSFITFKKCLGTGSSIMPQKQNWDALELIRAKYYQTIAFGLGSSTSVGNLPSGYNRDMQQIKGNLMKAVETTLSSIKITGLFIYSITVNEQQIQKHIPKELFAAHWAYMLVQEKSLPFRKAYIYVKKHLNQIPDFNVASLLKQAISQGSTGNLQLTDALQRIREEKRRWKQRKKTFGKVINLLIQK